MEIPATITSKGHITIPASIREALQLKPGDRVVFRLSDDRAVIRPEHVDEDGAPAAEFEKIPDFFELAGSVPTPPDVDSSDWASITEAAWMAAVQRHL